MTDFRVEDCKHVLYANLQPIPQYIHKNKIKVSTNTVNQYFNLKQG